MLSGLTFGSKKDLEKQFREEQAELQKSRREEKKKQKKESKKQQKDKRKKERRKHASSSDSEPGSGPEDAWLQQQEASDSPGSPGDRSAQPAGLQREDWMTVPMARSFAGQPEKQQEQQQQQQQGEEAPVVAGIRYMKPEQAAAAAAREEARRKAAEAAGGSGPAGAVPAAAGVNWRVKALQRAQQVAKESGRDLNEVLSERWGSAAEVAKGIMDNAAAAAAEQRPDRHQHHQQQQQQRGGSVPHYLSSGRSGERGMMRPPALSSGGAGSSKLSWRRPAAGGSSSGGREQEDRQPPHDSDRDRGREQHEREREWQQRGQDDERDRQHRDGGRDRDRDRQRGQERGQEHDRERERHDDRQQEHSRREERERDSRGGSRPHDSSRGRDRERQHDSSRDRDRDRPRDSSRDRGQHGWRDGEQRGHIRRDFDRPSARDRDDRSGSMRQPRHQERQQPPAEVVEALKAVAGSINTFSNDGSFMQQFQQQQQPGGQQQRQRSASPGSSMEQDEPQQQRSRSHGDDAAAAAAAGAAGAPKLVSADGTAAAAAAGGNQSKADLLRAKLGGKASGRGAGNRSAADALRARLGGKAAPAAAAGGAEGAQEGGSGHEVVHLPLVDAAGRAAPGAFGRETAADTQRALEAAAGGRVAKRVQRYGADGTRERYFADDDSTDLQTLVKRAKHGDDALDIDRALMSNIAKRQRFKESDMDPDAEYDYDAGVDLSDSRRKRGDVQQQAARERQRQVAQFNRLQRLEDKCVLCFKSPGRNQDLAIAVGQSSYLSLLPKGKLVEGHCCIVTQEHVPSMRQVDDDTWSEVRNWQKCLINMYLAQGKQVIFLETAMAVGSHKHHALLEALPVDEEVYSKAPLYFKKAMEEAESEWSTHAAKAAIPTRDKGLRGSIPPNFPYLYVQFGPNNGYVHVIDDEAKFDRNLGRQVLVGLLRLPAEVMHRRAAALDAGTVKREAAAFRKQFSRYF